MLKKINKKALLAAWSCNNKYWVIHQAYHIPLRNIFNEVVNFDPQEVCYNEGKDEMNRKFLEVLKKEKPDYVMLFLIGDEFYPETLVKIKEILPNVKVFQWNGDDDIKFENYTIPYSLAIDYQLISQLQFTESYEKYGIPWFDLLGADTKKFKSLNVKKKYDVAFVGTPKGDRLKYMRHLLKNNVNFVLGGGGWDDYPEFKNHYLGQLSDDDFVTLINKSKINICFSQNYLKVPHVLERSLQVNSCKSFALTEYVDGYFKKFTEGKDFASFKDEKELVEKIKYYLRNEKEREKIALNAYKKVTKLYSLEKMLRHAIEKMEKDRKELHSRKSRKYMKIKPVYLEKSDFIKGKKHIENKIKNYKYVGFRDKKYKALPYRDYYQIYSMELIGKPVSICDVYLNSALIGDYAYLMLYYAFNFLEDKKYLYDNIALPQFIVRKDFFAKNIDEFLKISKGRKPEFINEKNTQLITVPLMRVRKKTKLPIGLKEHVVNMPFEEKLLPLRNQGKLISSTYAYKVLFYSLFVNRQILKHLLNSTFKRSKNKYLVKMSNLFNK